MGEKPVMWTLEQGLDVVKSVQQVAKLDKFHVVIGGGVVNNGVSRKDLDLYFLPFDDGSQSSTNSLVTNLVKLWGPYTHITAESYSGSVFREKIKFGLGGKRIDVFIL